MLKVQSKEPGIIEIEIDGEIDATEMEAGLNRLFELSADLKGGGLFYRITNFAMPTMAAIGVKMTSMPKLFALITKFDKAAVLTDESWIATASSIEGALIPGLDIKPFDLDAEEAALAYLRGQ